MGEIVPTNAIRRIGAASDGHSVAVLIQNNTSEDVVQVYISNGSPIGRSTSYRRAVDVSRDGSVVVMGVNGYAMVYQYGRTSWIRPGTNLSSNTEFASR